MEVTVEQLQSEANSLVDRVEAGESIVVTRSGRPVAEIRPLHLASQGQRPAGLCVGEFVVPNDFDDPLPNDVVNVFYSH